MSKNNSKRNNAATNLANTNARITVVHLDQQQRAEGTADITRRSNDLSVDTAHCDGAYLDPIGREDETLDTAENLATADSSPAVTAHNKERVAAAVWPQIPFRIANHSPQVPAHRLQTETTHQSTPSNSSHFEARSTRANELLPDLVIDSTPTMPVMWAEDFDDDFSSQVELAFSQDWTQGAVQEPWNGFEFQSFSGY